MNVEGALLLDSLRTVWPLLSEAGREVAIATAAEIKAQT